MAGKIDLYVGKEVVRKAIPSAQACDELIDLIKEHGRYVFRGVRSLCHFDGECGPSARLQIVRVRGLRVLVCVKIWICVCVCRLVGLVRILLRLENLFLPHLNDLTLSCVRCFTKENFQVLAVAV